MISTLGYHAPSSPRGSKTRFSTGVPSPLQLQSSLFVSSRRPSIPSSPGLLPLLSLPPASQPQLDITDFGCAPVTRWSVTPIHQLPVEILCDIFSYCEAQSPDKHLGPKVTISHVCRRWRSVVLCMPLLWTYIYAGGFAASTIHRVSAYLRRSGSCQISVAITSDSDLSSTPPAEVATLWSIIQSHAQRLKALRLELRGSALLLIRSASGCQFPALGDLDVQLRACPQAVANELMSILQRGSCLASLNWLGDLPASTQSSYLTRLRLRGIYTPETVCSILRQCPRVQEVSVDTISGDEIRSHLEVAPLPDLHKLEMRTLVDLSCIFRQLHVPVLRTMQIRQRISPGITRNWMAFGQMLLRSKCKMRKLTLSDVHIQSHDLVSCLRLSGLQDLEELHIRQPDVTDSFLSTLEFNPIDTSSSVFPMLRTLCLGRCHSLDGVLRRVLYSRTSACGIQAQYLTHVEVDLDEGHELDISYLKLLQSEGVHVVLNLLNEYL